MRTFLSIGIVALLAVASVPGAQATDTGSADYVTALGVAVDHGVAGVPNGNALALCNSFFVTNLGGCVGGGQIFTSECVGIQQAGGSCATSATRYLAMTIAVQDAVSGSNVYVWLCNYNLEGLENGDNSCDAQGISPYKDAFQAGCGQTLTADATGLHAGNYFAVAFTYNAYLDPTTTQVCVGTQGSLSVVFS